jgi:2-hydroxy-3-keto-5-methylthiopentenyl-1-phosphate phosphatase
VAGVITLDFDDTVVLENTTRLVFERFAGPGWRDFEAQYHGGLLSVEAFNAAAIDLIDPAVSEEEVRRAVLAGATLRDGFLELLDWAHWHGWVVAVVSNGFDIAVDAVLDRAGVRRVVRHAGSTKRAYRWRVRYLSPRGIEIASGFKLAYAQAFRAAGDLVVYAGDGSSDIAAAGLAHAVFARSTLFERLRGARPRVFAFETFHDVIATLDKEAGGWLASFSSTTAAEG